MERFFAEPSRIRGGAIHFMGQEAHHIATVLRQQVGEQITATDGQGHEYQGHLVKVARGAVLMAIAETRTISPERPAIALVQALPKREKMAWIVEKATELGVSRIIPVLTERAVARPAGERAARHVEHWRSIAVAALKQSGRAWLPDVHEIVAFREGLALAKAAELRLIPTLGSDTKPLAEVLRQANAVGSIVYAIGPEGDFTPAEVTAAVAAGFQPVSLGTGVLRSETAAIAMLAILRYALKNK